MPTGVAQMVALVEEVPKDLPLVDQSVGPGLATGTHLKLEGQR